jgi:site-specific recombinase XerC
MDTPPYISAPLRTPPRTHANGFPALRATAHPRYKWRLTWQDAEGKPRAHYFTSREAAQARLRELTHLFHQSGAIGIALDAAERAEWWTACRALEGTGVTILDAVRTYLRDHPPGLQDTPFSEAVQTFLDEKRAAKRSTRTIDALEDRLAAYAEHAGIVNCTDLTHANIVKFVFRPHITPTTQINDLAIIREWCRWAVKPRNAFLPSDPTATIERPSRSAAIPLALATDEALRCLAHAETQPPSFRLYIFLSLLAGMRQSEIHAITRPALDAAARTAHLAVIGIGKRGKSRRTIPLCARLRAMIRATSPALPRYSQKRFAAMKVAVAPVKWCNDITRHTWISHRLAQTANPAQTAMEAGNDPATMHAYYVDPRTPAQARLYFTTKPNPTTKPKPK